jgi:type IV pilus assembly protein PilB
MNTNSSQAVSQTQLRDGCAAKVLLETTTVKNPSAVVILDALIEQAFASCASDIHIDPAAKHISVRFRVDGVLQIAHELPLSLQYELLSRLKILCGLRTDEHQTAQDGRLRHLCSNGITIDIRVSIMPLYYGENAVLRLLIGQSDTFSLQSLGFSEQNQEKILAAMKKPYGMILATGPTGSGKTTTLYTLLSMQDATQTSIVTIEDPIEYAIEGVNQIQVNSRTGLTFAHGLRSMLRQDPNTIMVGEVRDGETAGLAVNIALTGHVVVSTLHTNDAATTLPRLLDMKIEPYLIASTVNIAIGQRLVRRLCIECKKEKYLSENEIEEVRMMLPKDMSARNIKVYEHGGCTSCAYSGYSGRIGIHEVLVVSPRIREAIIARSSASYLRKIAIDEGMVPLIMDGMSKVLSGITTVEEVLKINYE